MAQSVTIERGLNPAKPYEVHATYLVCGMLCTHVSYYARKASAEARAARIQAGKAH